MTLVSKLRRFSEADDAYLIRAARSGLPIKTMMHELDRGYSSVMYRLKLLRLIEKVQLPERRPINVKLSISQDVHDRLVALAAGKGIYLARYMSQVLTMHVRNK